MGEQQLLKSVNVLNNIKQRPSDIVAGFYGRFNKDVGAIDIKIGEGDF